MRILIIGGTAFVGRHITAAALAAGHEVTLFHRGQTGAGLFPEATHLLGDRNGSLASLGSGTWDATVDVSGYVPRQVRELAAALDGRGGRQVYISTTSVYQAPVQPGFDEDAPLVQLADPGTEEITAETYGGLKVLCEQAATQLYGAAQTAIVRPTYVVGPYDRTFRFTWWVQRIARGGTVLAPGDAGDPIQVIDARDLASFVIGLAERSVAGVFHTVSPQPPFGFGTMLEAIAAEVAPPGTRLTWVDKEFLLAAGEDDASLPMWPGADSDSSTNAADPARALAAGLTFTPLAQTIADLRAAEAVAPTTQPPGTGLPAEREAGLLAQWAAHTAG